MIIYLTKETCERYKVPMPEALKQPENQVAKEILETESGDRLLEWGGKLFYFDRRKCLQVVNFASKVTFFLMDIKKADFEHIGNLIAMYLMDIYAGDAEMQRYLEQYFAQAPNYCFAKLKDKSAISTLNRTQYVFAGEWPIFRRFIENGVLKTRELNRFFNWEELFTITVDKRAEYFYPAEKFRALLLERYGK